MADIKYVMYSLDFCANKGDCKDCLYEQNDNEDSTGCLNKLMLDALELLKEQQAEIERMKAEKNRVIEQIESEIHMLFKERGCVKDDVGIAQYQWLINGYQSALDMIKDGGQE